MEEDSIRVIVVDDDFMIAKVHAKLIDSQKSFQVVGVAHNYEQTIAKIQESQPDLLLLDVYLPDRSGLDLLRTIRSEGIPCDVILITAAKERSVVEEGFRLGIFDYLIKPFDLDHLESTLAKYSQFKSRLANSNDINQVVVDNLKRIRLTSSPKNLQTGIDYKTLERIKECLWLVKDFESAERIAGLAKVSRSTARMYLSYLVDENQVEEQLLYGTVGRPQKLYRILV